MRYFDMEKIERGTEPLSPSEQEVRERLSRDPHEQLVAALDLETALATLSPRQQACFRLVAEGWTEREIASQLGLSRGNVHQYLAAARHKLQKFFQESG